MRLRLANGVFRLGMRMANVTLGTRYQKQGLMIGRIFSRVADWMTAPITGTERQQANLAHPIAMKDYQRGIISDRELARFVRSR